MTMLQKRTPKSARRRLGVALLGVMAGLGLGAYAVFAAGGGSDFSITRTPASQTVSRGQTATYTVTVKRLNGFARPVALKVSQLPGGSIGELEAQRRDDLKRLAAQLRPGPADDQDGVGHDDRHLASADHGDERQPVAHDHRHAGRPVVVAAELHPGGLAVEPLRAAGRSDELSGQRHSHRRLQRTGQPERGRIAERRHRLVEPEPHRSGSRAPVRRSRSGPQPTPRPEATT